MAPTSSETIVRDLLHEAGIEVNGNNPWDIQVLDPRFYERLLREPHLTMGEGYMHGWWECEAIDELDRAHRARQVGREGQGQLEGRAAHPPLQAVQPADVDQGLRGRQAPLRHRERSLSRHAGQAAQLHLRLLEERHDARRGAGSQARPGVQEDRRLPRHAHPRAGMRLGRLRQVRRREVRRSGAGRDRLRGTGGARDGAVQRAARRAAPAGLPRGGGHLRCRHFHRHHGACRLQELPHVHGGGQPLLEEGRRRLRSHDRRQRERHQHRPVRARLSLPERHAAFHRAARHRRWRTISWWKTGTTSAPTTIPR